MPEPLSLVVSAGRLRDGRVVDLGIAAGRFVMLSEPRTLQAATVIDADARLVTESFVNAHLHLDKVYTLGRAGEAALVAYTAGSMGGSMSGIELARAVKDGYDTAWILPNVRQALREAVRFGTLHIQAFADVDTSARLEGVRAVLAAREEFKDVLNIQVVAFPQEGLLRDPGAAALCEQALAEGADVVGGIPWIEYSDTDARAHIEWACGLAARHHRRVAMLVDDASDPSLTTTAMLAEAMLEHGLVGRGAACHARAIGAYEEPTQRRLAGLALSAGLGFVSDPHTGPAHLPVDLFDRLGIAVALGQDDIEDAYYPFGRNNMLEVAFLAAHLLGFLSAPDQERLVDFVTTGAARVLGIADHAIAPGNPANLAIHDSETVAGLLSRHAAPRWVISRGRVVAENRDSTDWLWHPPTAETLEPATRPRL
jgi:cytosine/creatinine deaminase